MLLTLVFNNPLFSYAQETSTQSAQMPTGTSSATLGQDSPFNTLTLDQNITPSATFKALMYVASLTKSNFQAKEQIQIVVKNAEDANLTATIEGGSTAPQVSQTKINGDAVFTLSPSSNLKPGKYKVKIINTDTNEVISEQQFTWGVLAINTNKSIYLPGETAKIAMAVLDEAGNMVCFAKVGLDITSPLGITTHLSTDDGTIRINKECWMHSYTLNPDYETAYATSAIGRYTTTITATTKNGSYTAKDRFEVRTEVPFDVERDTATRVYPADKYPVRLKIKANEAFKGKIVESVPTSFQISPIDDSNVIGYTQENTVTPSETAYGIPHLHVPFAGSYPVSQGFGQQIDDPQHRDAYKKSGLDGHDGVDFALPSGTPIAAVDGGKVILAQEKWIYGTSVVIEHKWGRTYYGHLSKLEVATGDRVISGQEIGLSGSTGLSTGPHLHFSLKPKEYDIYNLYFGKIDPAPYFGISTEDPVLSVTNYPIDTKAVVWNVDVEKGAEFTIGYQYKSPLKSPDFYTIGPLQFISSQKLVQQNAKFDVNENPFVLGTATSSAVLIASSSGELAPSAPTATPTDESVNTNQERVIFAEIRPWQLAIDATKTIEQQINIIDQRYKTSSTSYAPTDNSLGIVRFDPTKYNGESLYFEAVLTTADGTWGRYRSSSISLPSGAKEYTVRVRMATDSGCTGGDYEAKAQLYSITDSAEVTTVENNVCGTIMNPGGDDVDIKAARLVIVQSDTTNITDTQTQIEVGNNETSTGTAYADLTDKKIYRYTSASWDPTPTSYFEASLKAPSTEGTPADTGPNNPATGAQDTTVGGTAWGTYTNSFSDNTTYDSVSLTKGSISYYNKATNFGFSGIPTDATIKGIKVEINGYVSNVLMDDSSVKIVKGGTVIGTDLASATDWPTSDAGAYRTYGGATELWGTTWSPSDINSNTGFGVAFAFINNKTGSPATYTGNIDHIRITVTYTPAVAQTTYAALYTTGGALVTGSEVSTTSTSWTRVRTASSITLADATDYVVRIKTSTGGTANIANAKIILDQTQAGGISALETVHQQINTVVTHNTSTYTLQDFDNEFNPANWAGGTFNYYFEATMKRGPAGTTGYAQLYNVTDSDPVDTATNSEISTSSNPYERQISADLSGNTDWPIAAKTLDSQIHGLTGDTTVSVASSWLVIKVSGLATVSGPTNNQLMRHGQWFDNGVRQSFYL